MPTINLGRHKKRDQTVNSKAYASVYSSKRWRKLRHYKLMNDPLCEECLKQGRTTSAREVHHIIPFDIQHPDETLIFDYDNLQSLCVSCHRTIQNNL
jgi:5-methylcytosine-specific restriction enzyme A